MNKIFAPLIGAVLAASFISCQQNLASVQSSSAASKAVGTLELSFDSQTSKATALIHAGGQTRAVQTNANVTFSPPATLGVLTDVGNNVQYINAQFNVNNLVGSSLTDLTLIAYQKTGNMGGTALKNVYNFAGSSLYATNDPTGVAFVQGVKPVNPPTSVSPFVVNNAGSDLQLFTESELPSLESAANTANELSTAGGEYLLPYGFVARSSATSRTLAASTNNAGTVNIAIQVPTSNSSGANTGYRFTMTFVMFDAPVATRVSESLQEQGASSGAATRATSFAANQLAVLAGSAPTTTSDIVNACRVRTAGTAASPSAFLAAAPSTAVTTLDQCFAKAGKKDIAPTTAIEEMNDMIIQADGKIVMVGYTWNGTSSLTEDWVVVRLNPDGSRDRSFGTNGVVVIDFNSDSDRGFDVIQQADGKLVVGGWATMLTRDMGLVRLNTNGTLDTTFDGDGLYTLDINGSSFDRIEDLALQTVGADTYVIGAGRGRVDETTNLTDAAVIRFKLNSPTGLDTTFAPGGKRTFPWNSTNVGSNDFIIGVSIDSSNRIMLAGYNSNFDLGIARLTTAGALDTSFDSDGIYFINLQSNIFNVIWQNGKPIFLGNRLFNELYAIRFNITTPGKDTTFGSNGEFVYTINAFNADALTGAFDSSGRIILGGYNTSVNSTNGQDSIIARLSANGVADNTFSTTPVNGVLNIQQAAARADQVVGVAVDSNGKIVIAGSKSISGTDQDYYVLRMNP